MAKESEQYTLLSFVVECFKLDEKEDNKKVVEALRSANDRMCCPSILESTSAVQDPK